jgi:hypothetical protein
MPFPTLSAALGERFSAARPSKSALSMGRAAAPLGTTAL